MQDDGMQNTITNSWSSNISTFKTGESVGIDLGTTNSCISYWNPSTHSVKTIRLSSEYSRKKTIPSVVYYYHSNDKKYIGYPLPSETLSSTENQNFTKIQHTKRLIGQSYSEIKRNKNLEPYLTFPIFESNNHNDLEIRINDKISTTPETVATEILQYLKSAAQEKLQKTVSNAVITVPAYFSNKQRIATISAASNAGFIGIRLLNEPTAAAMAYGLFIAGKKNVMVFDIGGGTFDVSVMSIDEGVFDVLGVGGVSSGLAGEDINTLIYNKLNNIKGGGYTTLVQEAIEAGKIELSTESQTNILGNVVTQDQLQEWMSDFTKSMTSTAMGVLEKTNLTTVDIDEVILVGGVVRMPVIQSAISSAFDNRIELCKSIDQDLIVSSGAAIQAAILSGTDQDLLSDILMFDVLPKSIGIITATGDFEVLLEKNMKLPASATKYFDITSSSSNKIGLLEVVLHELNTGNNTLDNDTTTTTSHVGTFEFPLKRKEINDDNLYPVTVRLNQDGVLQVTAGVFHEESMTDESVLTHNSLVQKQLGGIILLLFILYISTAIYF